MNPHSISGHLSLFAAVAGLLLAGMAEENSASARQTSAVADRLQELAGELEYSVARFRV